MTWLAWKYRAVHRIDMMDGRHVIFYFWMFLGGSMACLQYTTPAVRKLATSQTAKILFGSSAILILLFVFMSSKHTISQLWKPLFPDLPGNLRLNGWHIPGVWFYLYFLLLFSITVFQDSLASRWLQSWLLRHLGLLSYSLYLFHIPVMSRLHHYGFKHEELFIAVFVVTYIIALLSYIVIEKPLLLLKSYGK